MKFRDKQALTTYFSLLASYPPIIFRYLLYTLNSFNAALHDTLSKKVIHLAYAYFINNFNLYLAYTTNTSFGQVHLQQLENDGCYNFSRRAAYLKEIYAQHQKIIVAYKNIVLDKLNSCTCKSSSTTETRKEDCLECYQEKDLLWCD